MLDIKNALLKDIKDAVEAIISADNQVITTLNISDTLRHNILTCLISYSDKIPHPASGFGNNNAANSNTLIRWQILGYVASIDLTIAKWFESHLDALSILYEVGYSGNTDSLSNRLWAVWASEGHPLSFNQGKLNGTKAWCSGANIVDYGLMTYRDTSNDAQLLIVDMQEADIEIDNSGWQAVGMQATDTATMTFTQAIAHQVGGANAYLDRVGFWHGAAGVAACWYGAAARLAEYLVNAYQTKPNDYKAMYLGQISTSLAVTQQYFYSVAELIDSQPHLSHELAIRQLRANVEQLARQVIEVVGQALGAAPFCANAHFARLSADLAVFIRQSHGAFDLQKIGELTSEVAGDLDNMQGNNKRDNIWQL